MIKPEPSKAAWFQVVWTVQQVWAAANKLQSNYVQTTAKTIYVFTVQAQAPASFMEFGGLFFLFFLIKIITAQIRWD